VIEQEEADTGVRADSKRREGEVATVFGVVDPNRCEGTEEGDPARRARKYDLELGAE
jgi:hypothetical protein